jgi:hypothetical protein
MITRTESLKRIRVTFWEISSNMQVGILLLVMASLFILNEPARLIFNDTPLNISINIPCLISSIAALIVFAINGRIEKKIIYFSAFFTCIVLTNFFLVRETALHYSIIFTSLIIPFLITGFRLEAEVTRKLFKAFLTFLNTVCSIILSFSIIDYFTNGSLQTFLANNLFAGTEFQRLILYEHSLGIYRMYSIFGHPLTNALYFLEFFLLNNVYNRYYCKKLNSFVIAAVTLTGLVLCGSKSGMILGLILILFFNNISKYKSLYYCGLISLMVLIFLSPMFQQNIMKRYMEGLEKGDLSSGRNMVISELISGSMKQPELFTGGGINYSRAVVRSLKLSYIKNFEYPPIMYSYDISIVGAIIIYIIVFIIPAVQMIRKRKYYILSLLIILTLYINGYNDIANYADCMGQVCLIIMLLKNISSADFDTGHQYMFIQRGK